MFTTPTWKWARFASSFRALWSQPCWAAASVLLALSGCASTDRVVSATAWLVPQAGSRVTGKVEWTQRYNGTLKISGQVRGLTPLSQHAWALVVPADCDAPAAPSPAWQPRRYTVIALPPLQSNANGMAIVQWDAEGLNLEGARSLVGRTVVIPALAADHDRDTARLHLAPWLACGVVVRNR